MFLPQRLVYKLLDKNDVVNMATLPAPSRVAAHTMPAQLHEINQLPDQDGIHQLVVFLDPENPSSILEHPALKRDLTGMHDVLFTRDPAMGKPKLRTDPFPVVVDRSPGNVRVLHLTMGGSMKGSPKDDNFEVPTAWRDVAGKLKPVVEGLIGENQRHVGLILGSHITQSPNAVHAVKALGRGLGNVAVRADLFKPRDEEIFKDGNPPEASAEASDRTPEDVTRQVRKAVENVLLLTDIESPKGNNKLTEAFREGDAVSQMQAMARFLAECPHNILDCETFVKVLLKLADVAKALGNFAEIEVYGPETADRSIPLTGSLESLNLNVLKAVHQGSVHETGPFMVRIRYRGIKDGTGPVDTAVFKCIMQDNGGHCAKGEHATDMQGDMAAGATGAALFAKCAEDKPEKNIDFVFAIASNTADAHAYEVNDVLEHASGVTTEIINTDAEGRLALADCLGATLQLHRKEKIQTGKITVMATLTGHSVLVGGNSTQVYSHSRRRLRDIEERSICNGEPYQGLRLMPIDAKAIEGDTTMLKNIGVMPGPRGVNMRGSQTAAEYIRLAAGIDEKKGDFAEFDIATALSAVKHGTPKDIAHSRFPMDFVDTAYEYLTAA